MSVKLDSVIAPSFYELHDDIRNDRYTHYVLTGGRGSTKSSVVSVELILGLIKHPDAHAIVLRKVSNTLHDSVFAQLLWAIETLGLSEYFKVAISPLKITYKPTGQTILFRGADDPMKIVCPVGLYVILRGLIATLKYSDKPNVSIAHSN